MAQNRRRDHEYVTRGELRQFELRLTAKWSRLLEALDFYDRMCELGLRELLPLILDNERLRLAARALADGRYRWVVRLAAYLLPLSLSVATVGGSIAILRTVGWMR